MILTVSQNHDSRRFLFVHTVGNYMFKVNNRNTRTSCEICSKLTIKTPERRHWRHNSEAVSLLFFVQEKSKAYDKNVAGILTRFEKFLGDRKFFAGDKVSEIMDKSLVFQRSQRFFLFLFFFLLVVLVWCSIYVCT